MVANLMQFVALKLSRVPVEPLTTSTECHDLKELVVLDIVARMQALANYMWSLFLCKTVCCIAFFNLPT